MSILLLKHIYTTNHIIITVQRIHYKQKGKKEDIKTNAFVVCLVFHLDIFLVFKLPKPKVPEPQVSIYVTITF